MTEIKISRPNDPAEWEEIEDDSPYRMYPQVEDDHIPNVVRIDVPSDTGDEAAAWVYVPSKDTVYVGPWGSSHLDLADALKHTLDMEKGEQILTGALYQDGFSDIYSVPENEAKADRVLDAVSTFFDLYYSDMGGSFVGEDEGDDDEHWTDTLKSFKTGPGTTDAVPEDYDDDSGKWEKYWAEKEKWGDRGAMDPTVKPLGTDTSQWSGEDWVKWTTKDYGGYGWTPRESLPHFRWSYGNPDIVPQSTHNGFFPWPVEDAYPDHFTQTGSNGLGYNAQGRVYPHTGNRWEILTWPQRPRYVQDNQIKKIMQHEAQQAAKDWLMNELEVPEENIYFTEGDYGRMVIDYTSPSYGGKQKSIRYDDADGSAVYEDSYTIGDATDPDAEYVSADYDYQGTRTYTENFMNDLEKSYQEMMTRNLDWKPKNEGDVWQSVKNPGRPRNPVIDPTTGVQSGPGHLPRGTEGERPWGVTQSEWDAMSPEDKYQARVQEFERRQRTPPWSDRQNQYSLWNERPTNTQVGTPFSEGMQITDQSGTTTTISEADYDQAVAELGTDKWFYKWLKPGVTPDGS